MSNSEDLRVLDIFLGDTIVGTITLTSSERTYFEFAESYRTNENRPTLSLNFKTKSGLAKNIKPARQRIHPFFSNLLPEGKLREYLSKKLEINPQREFFLLAGLGLDLPGAVRAKPKGNYELPKERENEDQENADTRVNTGLITPMRFSLAGVQLKFSAIESASGGLTIPVTGSGGSWIIKLPSLRHDNLPETEFSMLLLGKKMGINLPEFRLVQTREIEGIPSDIDESFGESLAIKRFDRPDGEKRIHIEDFAQVFGLRSNDKYDRASYDNIAEVLALETTQDDFIEYIRRLIFMIATGNGDMHVKNWSLIYADSIKPRLSPAYDFLPTVVYNSHDTLGLSLGGTKSFQNVDLANFVKLASKARMSESLVRQEVEKAVEDFAAVWKDTKFDLPLPKDSVRIIEQHFQNTKLFKGKWTGVVSQVVDERSYRGLHGDIDLDESVPSGTIRFRLGKKEVELEAPPVMSEWAVGEKAREAADYLKASGSVNINGFVNRKLFNEWRRNNYIVIESKSLSTKVFPRDLHSGALELRGLFMPNNWKKLIDTTKNRSDFTFDLVFSSGSAWTWKGRVLEVFDQERLVDGRTTATLNISINNPRLLYGAKISAPKIKTRKILNYISEQEDGLLDALFDFILNKYTEGNRSGYMIGTKSHSFSPIRIGKAEVYDEEHIEIRVDFVINASLDIEVIPDVSQSESFEVSTNIPEKFFISVDVVFNAKIDQITTLRTRVIEPIYECRLVVKKAGKKWKLKTDSFKIFPDAKFNTDIVSEDKMKTCLADLYVDNEKNILQASDEQTIQLTNAPSSSLEKWDLFH